MFLGTTCVGCSAPADVLCDRCAAALPAARPFPPPAGLASCTALLEYRGPARELVLGLKYRNGRRFAGPAATALAEKLRRVVAVDELVVVTWAPTSDARRRGRGYDQAQLLAHLLGRRLDLPVAPLLERRAGPAQTGRDRRRRVHGPAFAWQPRGVAPVGAADAGAVLLVDDVVTTGATLAAAARQLAAQGLSCVHGAVIAHTPG